jgi:gliding motility-associated-like protein
MKTNLFFWCFAIALFSNNVFSQQLIINEVSQGPSGAQEYVELLVVGTPTCNAIPCMDLRNYIIDDNNGNHATGSGTGIAAGCVRLKNIPFWSCIPIGTMILIYNDADQNPLIPLQDLSMSDGNCKLVIPISDCTLLERHTSQPSTGSSSYPSTAYTNCGLWSQVSMANADDSFQTINSIGGLEHSVSWGNNTLSTIIYFNSSAAGKVALMTNSTDNNPANQANWIFVTVAGNESPGAANNLANSNWILSMNNSCLPLQPFSTSVLSNNAGCICNGSATVTANGAIAPYTYTWFPSGGNSTTASGLCSGVYTISSTSSNGCLQTKTVTISNVSSLSLSVTNTSVTCNGMFNGSATVSATAGNAPYSYTWAPSAGNSSVAIGLNAGIYTVTVKDANNCTATATTTILQPTLALAAIISHTNVSCFGGNNGMANVNVTGGTTAYNYTWSPSGGNNPIANNLTAGSYSVFIQDANNCMFATNVTINQPSSGGLTTVISSTNNLCFGVANGALSANVTGGTPAYTYSWIPTGGNNSFATGLMAGSYSVIIKDANNCTTIATSTITQPSAGLSASISSFSANCFGSATGSATVNVNGGTPGYSYTWSPSGGNTSNASGLTAGNYTVSIKDITNCTLTSTVLISEPAKITLSVNSLTLCGSQPGILSASVSGGNGPFIYNWNGTSTSSNSISVTTTANINYTVGVTDSKGCSSNNQITNVNIASLLNLSIGSSFSVCSGDMITLAGNASGGTGNYSYLWQPGNMAGASQVISNATASQTYTLNVSDGCSSIVSKTLSVFIYPTPFSDITSSLPTGCAPLCISFSNTPLQLSELIDTYTWSFGDNAISSFNLPEHCYNKPGDYSIILNYTTINGCIGTQTLVDYVHVYPQPKADFTMDKNEISIYNTSVIFTNQTIHATDYTWYFSDEGTSHETNPSFNFITEENKLILLIATNEFGCIDTIMKEIKYLPDFTFFAPNTFSPNNDNLNELFLPFGIGWNTNKFELDVYDRWGEKIFGTKRYDEGWDGKLRGTKVKNDIYVWKVSVYDMQLKRHEYIGHILVEAN